MIPWRQADLHQRQYDAAITSGEKAIELGPNIAESYVLLGQTLNYSGRTEEGTSEDSGPG